MLSTSTLTSYFCFCLNKPPSARQKSHRLSSPILASHCLLKEKGSSLNSPHNSASPAWHVSPHLSWSPSECSWKSGGAGDTIYLQAFANAISSSAYLPQVLLMLQCTVQIGMASPMTTSRAHHSLLSAHDDNDAPPHDNPIIL